MTLLCVRMPVLGNTLTRPRVLGQLPLPSSKAVHRTSHVRRVSSHFVDLKKGPSASLSDRCAKAVRRLSDALPLRHFLESKRNHEIEADADFLDDFIATDLTSLTFASERGYDELSAPPFIIFDDSPARIMWDIVMAFLIMFYVFVVPIRIAFMKTTSSDFMKVEGSWLVFDIISDIAFWLDIG